MNTPKYQFYEIVRVGKHCRHRQLIGREGAILGMSQNEQGIWGYAVALQPSGECWDLVEDNLESTGRMERRETFYDGTSVTVTVNPQTSEGEVNEGS
jgi:hypothetical protein